MVGAAIVDIRDGGLADTASLVNRKAREFLNAQAFVPRTCQAVGEPHLGVWCVSG